VGQVRLPVFPFSPVSIIQLMPHMQSFITDAVYTYQERASLNDMICYDIIYDDMI